jgi:hypothetical protein
MTDKVGDNVIVLNCPERPFEITLYDALESAIYDIAPGKMTPIEVLGCLDKLSKDFYRDHFID